MDKSAAVESMGQQKLLLPSRIRASLAANDRLKLYLTVLQAAADHAAAPEHVPVDLTGEFVQANLHDAWIRELPLTTTRVNDAFVVPGLPRLVARLREDLVVMAGPIVESSPAGTPMRQRLQHWDAELAALSNPELSPGQLRALVHGNRRAGDSLHIVIMDLHKALNRLAATVADERLHGAHVWQICNDDRPRIAAFMRGLNRTRGLKFDHPGLETAATRDGGRLLLQNDIGTNDAHVLVIQVEELTATLTYSDLHKQRFAFFRDMLVEIGAIWSAPELRTTAGLNAGEAYHLGTATFRTSGEDELRRALEGIGARIVYLIDWNRARKKLLAFVDKRAAVEVLGEAARREAGHMGWLNAGGERLLWDAMAAQGAEAFRLGDRLDDAIGAAGARAFLIDTMMLASTALRRSQPVALIADETRMLLTRHMRRRGDEFELLAEHAAYCHTLAGAVSDALARGMLHETGRMGVLAGRAKAWERQADELVMQSRERADRQPQWRPLARLIEVSDDVADALEEAMFLLDLAVAGGHAGWNEQVVHTMLALANAVRGATQDHIKALAVARTLGDTSDSTDHDEFLAATWRVLQAEKHCDDLLRLSRRALLGSGLEAGALMVATEIAAALEMAADKLLGLVHGLRERVFSHAGAFK